jgi:hypothetical protein
VRLHVFEAFDQKNCGNRYLTISNFLELQ